MKKVIFIILFVLVVLAVVPIFLPKTMHVEQEYEFDAPVEEVYNYFADFKQFTRWNAWTQSDPNIELQYSTPTSGIDAYYTWKSEKSDLGEGKMSIVEAGQNDFLKYNLQFGEMKGNWSEAIFQKIDEDHTKVIWTFDNEEVSYPFQLMNVLMKGAVENKFDEGFEILAKLIAKDKEEAKSNEPEFSVIEEPTQFLFGILQETSTQDEELSTAMAESFGMVYSYLRDVYKMEPSNIGKPVTYWQVYDESADKAVFYCGFFIDRKISETDDMKYVEVPSAKVLVKTHYGPYNTIGSSYEKMMTYAAEKGWKTSPKNWAIYLNDPEKTEQDKIATQIFVPIEDAK